MLGISVGFLCLSIRVYSLYDYVFVSNSCSIYLWCINSHWWTGLGGCYIKGRSLTGGFITSFPLLIKEVVHKYQTFLFLSPISAMNVPRLGVGVGGITTLVCGFPELSEDLREDVMDLIDLEMAMTPGFAALSKEER